MKLKCKNKKCKYEWEYRGENPFYACCPRCKGSVKIETKPRFKLVGIAKTGEEAIKMGEEIGKNKPKEYEKFL